MSITTALRDATTGHIMIDQTWNGPEPAWVASAILKPIIVIDIHHVKDSPFYSVFGGPSETPIDALVSLAGICAGELWAFHTQREDPK